MNENHSRRKDDLPLYTRYERVWHWVQAVGIILLLLLGLEIHAPDRVHLVGFATAVSAHNVLGFLLILNGVLAFFYHVTTGEIRQFVPGRGNFLTMAVSQTAYYARGIFRGEPHPFDRSREHKLNPLQKITYLVILTVLLPLQVVTGVLLWGAQRWPVLVDSLGGLRPLAGIHALGAWLFAAFLILHVYLTTTGPTPLAYLKAMLIGRDPGPAPAPPAGGSSP